MKYFDAFGVWINEFLRNTWSWLNSLSYHEWFLLLALTTVVGFMCMRGFGSRAEY